MSTIHVRRSRHRRVLRSHYWIVTDNYGRMVVFTSWQAAVESADLWARYGVVSTQFMASAGVHSWRRS